MPDRLDRLTRSRNMAAVRSRDSKPELLVRSIIHRLGYRFRLHRPDLPGKPDIVLPRLRALVFVHGCFWHMHHCPRGLSMPSTNSQFWKSKRESTAARDQRQLRDLRKSWRVLVVWECETKNHSRLERRICKFLES